MNKKIPVIYNADFGTLGWSPEVWEPDWRGHFTKAGVVNFVKTLADNGVDILLMNPNSQVAWYPSKVWPNILDGYTRDEVKNLESAAWNHRIYANYDKDPLYYVRYILNAYLDLTDENIDWMDEIKNACREYGIELWASIRMNDMHFVAPGLKNYLISGIYENNHLKGMSHSGRSKDYYMALDYSKKEVRDYYFAIIKEMVEVYGCSGIELDWTRNAACMEYPASEEDRIVINEWLSMIKDYLGNKEAINGCKHILGMRVLSNIKMYRSIGIDVLENGRNKTLDYICPSNFVSCTWDFDYDELRKLTDYNCDIYGSTEIICNKLPCKPDFSSYYRTEYLEKTNLGNLRDITGSDAYFRGNAAALVAMGVDAIEVYNFFIADARNLTGIQSDYSLLKNISNKNFLRGKTKFHTLTTAGGGCNYPPFEMAAAAPVIIPFFQHHRFNVSMLDETEKNYELKIQIVIKKEDAGHGFGVSFNGSPVKYDAVKTEKLLLPSRPFGSHSDENIGVEFTFGAIDIHKGWNTIDVFNDRENKNLLVLSVETIILFLSEE
ncbi:MAG: hypothetical protein JW903_04115 [Clostridia bacterium]|nr:hypothetical protein [Clostridia bacterium]